MKKVIITIIILSVFLSACGPSESEMQEFLAQTLTAIEPTATDTATITPEPTSTPTSTPTFTATPDLRIIDVNPQEFLPEPEELPLEGRYYLPNSSWISPHTNAEVVAGWTVEKGREYINETGRIYSWWVSYKRGTSTVVLPDEIYSQVTQYKTSTGPELLLTKYSYSNRYPTTKYDIIKSDEIIGDNLLIEKKSEMTSGGDTLVWIYVETTYRNYLVTIIGYGYEDEVEVDVLINVAKVILNKLETAELSDPFPTSTPVP